MIAQAVQNSLLAKLSDESNGFNPIMELVAGLPDYDIDSIRFDFTPNAGQLWLGDIGVTAIEQNSAATFPLMEIFTQSEPMNPPGRREKPSQFTGQVRVGVRVHHAWYTDNVGLDDYESILNATFEVFTRVLDISRVAWQYGNVIGLIELSEISRTPLVQSQANDRLWRRTQQFVLAFLVRQ